ncbi:MAG: protein kinase [Vulcanimicrobiota bacterium]
MTARGAQDRLPDQFELRGWRLTFLEKAPPETLYRGQCGDRQGLVREGPHNLGGLKSEAEALRNLSHPCLPEALESFEENGYFYLITAFPQGVRMDQKMAVQNQTEAAILGWIQALLGLLDYIAPHGVFPAFAPKSLIRSASGHIRLIDLRERSAHLAASLQSLGECLKQWVTTPETALKQVLESLSRGLRPEGMEPSAAPGGLRRVPLPDGSKQTCLEAGTRLAGYEVEYFARGGMSLCYLGKLGNDVRFLKEVPCHDREASNALRREFEIMKALKHPNIVRVHLTFEQGGYLYLVMDYIEGSSLAAFNAQSISEERLLEWAAQLCEALAFLHSQNPVLIYRDLKPANILLSEKGQLYLIDFGLARTYKPGQAQDTQALGTFSTASPEHFTGQTDGRSDIFSLGATLYLLAHPGFKPKTPFVFPPLRKAQPEYSEAFEALLKRCTATKAEDRWPSARALANEIKKLQEPFLKSRAERPQVKPDAWREEVLFIPNLSSHVSQYARQLADLAGKEPLPVALGKVSESCPIEPLSKLWAWLASQENVAQAMSAFPRVFSRSYLDLVQKSGWQEAAALLEKEEIARRTRTSAATSADPLESVPEGARARRQRLLAYAVILAMALGLGGIAYSSLAGAGLPSWQPVAAGLGSSLLVGFVATLVTAVRDARHLRARNKAQNLVEDAWTSYALGETEKAEKELSDALVLSRDKLGANDLTTLASLHSLANLCRQRKDFKKADNYYSQALTLYKRVLPPDHPARGHLHHHWAQSLESQKRIPEAMQQLEASLAIWQGRREKAPLELAEVQFYKGRLHFDRDENEDARQLFDQSLELQYAELGLKSPLVHRTLSYLTRVYVRLKRYQKAEAHLATLLVEAEQDLQPNFAALAEANLDLGLIRLEDKKPQEAEPYFLRALQLLQHYVGPNERLLRRVLDGYRRIFGAGQEAGGVVSLISIFMDDREKIRQALEKHPEWVNARDSTGWGPIQWATFMGRHDIVSWLLARGADPGYDSSHAMGPLHVACAWDRADAMFVLLDKDPDVNASGPGGWTPVFWCAMTGQARLLESLLKRGAQVNALDDQGLSPLHIAATHGHLKLAASLLGAGAQVNLAGGPSRVTPLHLAAERGHLGVSDCLIFNGAELNLKDSAGQTPLDLAEKNRHRLLVRTMRRHLQEGLGRTARK